MSSLYTLDIKAFVRYIVCKYLIPFNRLPFHFIDDFLHYAKPFYFDVILFVYFCFCFSCLRRQTQKIMSKHDTSDLYYEFMDSAVIFNSLINFNFTFRIECKTVIKFDSLAYVSVHFSQHSLLKRLYFPHCLICHISIDQVSVGFFLDSPFGSIDLWICSFASTIQF